MEKRFVDTAKISFLDSFCILPYENSFPVMGKDVFIAPGSKIIGDVVIGGKSSVWYNSVIRGDVNFINIGSLTNVQDCSMLHVRHDTNPLIIGNKVTIGHSVKLHGCTIHDLCLIGIGAIVLDGAVVESKCIIAAGSVVKPGFVVPSGVLAAGVPAKIIRQLTQAELEELEISAERYFEYSKITVASLNKYIDGLKDNAL